MKPPVKLVKDATVGFDPHVMVDFDLLQSAMENHVAAVLADLPHLAPTGNTPDDPDPFPEPGDEEHYRLTPLVPKSTEATTTATLCTRLETKKGNETMASVTEEQRIEIVKLYREGKTYKEIAEQLNLPTGTVIAIWAVERRKEGLPVPSETEELIKEAEVTFSLERDMQSALRANIQQLEAGLEIYDGGKERTTDAGRIDITAKDQNGAVVVIELKAGIAAPEALTQVLAYMGTIAKEEQMPVRGLLIASDFHPRVVFAARAVSNVLLLKYSFKFNFEAVK